MGLRIISPWNNILEILWGLLWGLNKIMHIKCSMHSKHSILSLFINNIIMPLWIIGSKLDFVVTKLNKPQHQPERQTSVLLTTRPGDRVCVRVSTDASTGLGDQGFTKLHRADHSGLKPERQNFTHLEKVSPAACMHAKTLQSCLSVCNRMDCYLPDSSVHGISRQEYWSGLPCPPPGGLLHPGIKPVSLMSPALAGRFSTTRATILLVIYCHVTQ